MDVQTDAGSQVFEFASALDTEANNSASTQVTSALNDYPDLTITDIAAPATARSGESVPVSWTVKNAGSAATGSSWAEQVYLSSDAAVGNDVLLATFTYHRPAGAVAGRDTDRKRQAPGVRRGRPLAGRENRFGQRPASN